MTQSSPAAPADAFEQQAAEGVPVIVPVALPAGYALGAPMGTQKQGDAVVSASWTYVPIAGPDVLPVMVVCVDTVAVDACTGTEVTSPLPERRVTVASLGPKKDPAAEREWQEVSYTEQWRSAPWTVS